MDMCRMPRVHRLLDVVQASNASLVAAGLSLQDSSEEFEEEARIRMASKPPSMMGRVAVESNLRQKTCRKFWSSGTPKPLRNVNCSKSNLPVAHGSMQHARTHQRHCLFDVVQSSEASNATTDSSHFWREELEVEAQIEHAKTKWGTPVAQASSALLPFRGQVRVATRASKTLEQETSIGALCCVSPNTGDLVLLGDDLTQILRVPLEYLTITVVHRTSPQRSDLPCMILHVKVDTNKSVPSFFIAPASRAAANEWALLLYRCHIPVYGMVFPSSRTWTAAGRQHTPGTQDNQRRNAMNGTRQLVYWIKN